MHGQWQLGSTISRTLSWLMTMRTITPSLRRSDSFQPILGLHCPVATEPYLVAAIAVHVRTNTAVYSPTVTRMVPPRPIATTTAATTTTATTTATTTLEPTLSPTELPTLEPTIHTKTGKKQRTAKKNKGKKAKKKEG
jgi:hypothetical protein